MFGLPMKKVREGFRDVVSGRMVHRFRSEDGRLWLAHHRWDLLGRMEISHLDRERAIARATEGRS